MSSGSTRWSLLGEGTDTRRRGLRLLMGVFAAPCPKCSVEREIDPNQSTPINRPQSIDPHPGGGCVTHGPPKQPAVLLPALVICWELGGSAGVVIRAAGGGGLERPGFGVAVLSTEGQRSSWALQPRQDLREPIKKKRKKDRERPSDTV